MRETSKETRERVHAAIRRVAVTLSHECRHYAMDLVDFLDKGLDIKREAVVDNVMTVNVPVRLEGKLIGYAEMWIDGDAEPLPIVIGRFIQTDEHGIVRRSAVDNPQA